MTNPDYRVYDLQSMLSRSKHRDWQRDTLKVFTCLAGFIDEHGLADRTYLIDGQPDPSNDTIWNSHLTELGDKVIWDGFDKWLGGHDRGKPIEDMTVFLKALKKHTS